MAGVGEGLWVGIDVGTQGTKGVVLDAAAGTVIARAGASYDLIEGLPPGAAEQHPDTWIDAVREVCAALLATDGVDTAAVRGIGVSGQQHGFVPLDDDGEVIRPAKLWCDTATAAEAAELSRTFGRLVPTGFTASKILWLQRHEPENWTRLRTVLLPHDYVNYRLTGVYAMEAGDASGTGLFDPGSRMFDLHEVAAVSSRLPDMLPELVGAGEIVAPLSEDGASLTGLPAEIVVSTGGGDNMMSAIGSGATRPGVVVVSLGTSGTVFCHADQPVVDPEGLIAPFCDSTGGWLPLLCVMNLTGVTEEVVAGFAPQVDDPHRLLTRRAEDVSPGCDGLLWLPYLAGERVPDLPGATATLLGLRAGHLRGPTMYRAALEGTSLNLAWGVDRMRGLGIDVEAVRLVGGAANNPLWRKILAACLNAPVVRVRETESAALGGAIQALWTARRAAGEDVAIDAIASAVVSVSDERVDPDPDLVGAYASLGERFRAEVERLYPSD